MTFTLGNKIGEGGCSEIFEIGENKIIKIAKPNTVYEAARREYRNGRIAWECGLSVPEPFDFIDVDGRPGIIVEHIQGETIMDRLIQQATSSNKFNPTDIRMTAQQLSNIHSNTDAQGELQSQRSVIKNNINSVPYLRADEKEAVISLLDALPSKRCLCHGDPNPGNIIVNDDGKAVVIDWMNATLGNPEADIAEYIIMIRYAVLPTTYPETFRATFHSQREKVIDIFMDEYNRLTGMTYDEVVPWFTPIAARKLAADAISETEKEKLVQVVRRALNDRKMGSSK